VITLDELQKLPRHLAETSGPPRDVSHLFSKIMFEYLIAEFESRPCGNVLNSVPNAIRTISSFYKEPDGSVPLVPVLLHFALYPCARSGSIEELRAR
jgi:hypothetical protein